MLQWENYGDSTSLRLPLCELYIKPREEWNPDKGWNAPSHIIIGYTIILLDGEYGDGPNFAEKEVPAADMDTLKQQAIDFLREKIQETLEIIDNG